MITTKHIINSKQDIYSNYSQLDIYNAFINTTLEVGKLTNSPLRQDNNPSFIIIPGQVLIYFDFSTGDTGDCVSFVMRRLGVTYSQAINLISKQFKHSDNKIKYFKELEKSTIKVWYRDWEIQDKIFWDSFHITKKTLLHLKVYPILRYKINKYLFEADQLSYCYNVGSRLKIYQPENKLYKFSGNTNQNSIFGYSQMDFSKKELYIVSSLKEVAIMYELGYAAIAPNSESSLFKKEIMDFIKSKYNDIYVLFDWDEAGINFSKRFCNYYGNLHNIIIEAEEKDLSDYSRSFGLHNVNKLIKNGKNNLG